MPQAQPDDALQSSGLTSVEADGAPADWYYGRTEKAVGEQYWLYVVECALDESAAIYRIRDPARRVMQYLYDDGWRSLAD